MATLLWAAEITRKQKRSKDSILFASVPAMTESISMAVVPHLAILAGKLQPKPRGCCTNNDGSEGSRGLAATGLFGQASLTTTAERYIDSMPRDSRAALSTQFRKFLFFAK
jgi:hypothetical protein